MVDLITALALVFVTAGVLLMVANYLDLSSIPFYILSGLLVGTIVARPEILELAQWGIAFLVFAFGVRTELSTFSGVLRDGEVMAAVQVLVIAPLAFAIAFLFGLDPLDAVYVSIAATLSSTLVGTGLREAEFRSTLVHGRLAESVHFLQDLLAIVLVLVLSAEVFTGDVIAAKIGYGVVLLAVAVLINRHVFRLLSRLADGSQELMLMASISLLIGFLAAAEYVGISIVVGAFAAGLAIEQNPTQNLGMLNGIESIRDFFAAIFFVTLGALVSISTADVLFLALALVALTALLKPVVTVVTLLWEGYDARTATLTSVSLDQVSEFALILAIEALVLGMIAPEVFDAIILAAAVTMVTASYTRRRDHMIYERFVRPMVGRTVTRKVDKRSRMNDDLTGHIVIVGYGRLGRRLVNHCEKRDQPYVVVENDPAILDAIAERTRNYVFGDATHPYTWEKAAADRATLVVSTVDHRPTSERILNLATVDVILRADDPGDGRTLLDAGARYVAVPDVLAGDRLVEDVQAVIENKGERETLRERHREELRELAGLQDVGPGRR